jgi:hypothetical protein
MTNNTNSQHRKSVADTDNNPRVNKKLTQTNSRLSTLSNATKTTDVTYASSTNIHRPERTHRKNNIRTFSGGFSQIIKIINANALIIISVIYNRNRVLGDRVQQFRSPWVVQQYGIISSYFRKAARISW